MSARDFPVVNAPAPGADHPVHTCAGKAVADAPSFATATPSQTAVSASAGPAAPPVCGRATGGQGGRRRRFGYADPPYPGQAARLYGKHVDFAGEVDHAELISELLARFPDGWALSTSVRALPSVLRLCPERVLVCCWLKRATSPPMGDNRMYSWEPVILCDTPNPMMATRIHCEANADQYTFRAKRDGYVVGAKPRAFSFWLFDAMGIRPDDEFVDLFPGSGAVAKAWNEWRAQGRLTA